MKSPYLLFLAFAFLSCQPNQPKVNSDRVIRIQPFDGTNPLEIEALADSLRQYCPRVVVGSSIPLPEFAYYAPRKRYKADSMLTFLSGLAKPNETFIGITTKDISTKKGAVSDWGVIGLGKCPGNACMVSTFRLNKTKGKHQLFKAAIHELGHTMGLPHCPNNACYMRDAKGGNPLDEETGFCTNCGQFLNKRGWRITE